MNQINIKVIGVGGGSGNAINYMINEGLQDVDFIVADTDKQALDQLSVSKKIQLGINILNGQGAGMEPCKGRESAIESFKEIKTILDGADMVLVVAGFGGGTGTGAAPIIAQAAKEIGALTVSIVTNPFKFEGRKRTKLTKEGLEELNREGDSTIVVPNEKLLSIVEKNLGIKESFRIVDDILAQAVGAITKVILSHGYNDINPDFADVKVVMGHRGLALMGAGYATGANAAYDAAKAAIESPLLDNISIDGAMGVLVHFDIHPDYPIMEIGEAMSIVEESADEEASVIFGTTTNESMDIDEVRITIVATGFEDNTDIISSKISKESPSLHESTDILDVSRRNFEVDKMETINIWWSGPFTPNNIGYSDVPTFLWKNIEIPDVKTSLYSESALYLVYNLIDTEWNLLYIGMVTDDFYETHAKEWDIGYGQDMDTLMIYKGTLVNENYFSPEVREEKIKKTNALLNNILVDSSNSSQDSIINKNMIFLRNFNIEELLYPLLKSKYYWEDGLAYDIVERNRKKL